MAEQSLSAYGAACDADAARRELRRLGERAPYRAPAAPPAAAEPGVAGLSAREREVAARVAKGKQEPRGGRCLFLSEK